ncbi:unnamed protein product [Linum tenue]|uniref:Uncharacterized protein n=1 Tax=Linum tenue TaxID=586396 RepID=A0AAV0NJW0_9ROSI|nr:unnamed protein product [Linum tenue]
MTTSVRYKFLSSRDFSEIQIQGPYVTVGDLKLAIFKANFKDRSADSKSHIWNGCCLGTDHDLSIIDPQTNTTYSDENALIFDKSSVLLRRIPGDRRRQPLNTTTIDLRPAVEEVKSVEEETKSYSASDSVITTTSGIEDLDYDDFGGDVYAIPSQVTKPSIEKKKNTIAPEKKNSIAPAAVDRDEESKIMALVNTPALGMWSARKRKAPYSTQPPPNGYVCHRCGIKGHFIQDCPTNGDPSYDHRKRMRPLSTAPSAAADVITTSSSNSGGSKSNGTTTVGVPAELNCPLCRGIMREAVFVKSCCFQSYCKGCISDHVKRSKSCACGARNVDEGDFLPNVTVRSMIDSILQQRRSCSTGSSVGSNSCCSTVIGT